MIFNLKYALPSIMATSFLIKGAAAGCAAYSGIPLTHRDHAQACIFVTGHLRDGTVNLNWDMLAHASQTLVFYMGLHGLKIICPN